MTLLTQPMKPGKPRSLSRKRRWPGSKAGSAKTFSPDCTGAGSPPATAAASYGRTGAGRKYVCTGAWAAAPAASTTTLSRLTSHFMERLLSAPGMATLGMLLFESVRTQPRTRTPCLYRTVVKSLREKMGKRAREKKRGPGKSSRIRKMIKASGIGSESKWRFGDQMRLEAVE